MDVKVYDLAQQLLAEFTAALADTRAGAAEFAVVHPGNMVPQYGCGLAAVRVVTILPVQLKGPGPCAVEWQITYEMSMDRCYKTPPDNRMPPVGWLDSYARDNLEDAGAMRRAAVCAWPSAQRRQLGAWTPRGPEGAIGGGAMQVIALGVGLACNCTDEWPGIEPKITMVDGDPRM